VPNVKVFADQSTFENREPAMDELLLALRNLLCEKLDVTKSACHLVVVWVRGLADQPPMNIEIHLLSKPERTVERIKGVCGEIRDLVNIKIGCGVAVRCTMLEPKSYISLK
jgi:hypothetical protein